MGLYQINESDTPTKAHGSANDDRYELFWYRNGAITIFIIPKIENKTKSKWNQKKEKKKQVKWINKYEVNILLETVNQ